DLRLSAAGKEDIAGQRKELTARSEEVQALLDKFSAAGESAFLALAEEKSELTRQLADKSNELKVKLGVATARSLKTDLQRLEQARTENNMTLQADEACAGKDLPAATDIANRLSRKDGEIEKSEEALEATEKKRPTDAEKRLLKINLENLRRKARESAAAFKDADELAREPTRDLQNDVKKDLDSKRSRQSRLHADVIEAEKKA